MVYLKMVRMVRNRVLKAMRSIDDWRVESDEKIVRVADGLWVQQVSGKSMSHLNIGNADHGVAQIMLDMDDELATAFYEILNFHPSHNRKRSVLVNLGLI